MTDHLAVGRVTVDRTREPATMPPTERMLWLEGMLAEHAGTVAWLHAEVAQRDATIARLQSEGGAT